MITISPTHDAALLMRLNAPVQELHALLHPELFKPFDAQGITLALEEMLTDPSYRAYIAWKHEEAIGYVICFIRELPGNAFLHALRILYIDQIGVLPEYRKSGAGQLLMDHAENLAGELGIKRLELDHWSANTVAAAYFRKQGYTLCKERLFKEI